MAKGSSKRGDPTAAKAAVRPHRAAERGKDGKATPGGAEPPRPREPASQSGAKDPAAATTTSPVSTNPIGTPEKTGVAFAGGGAAGTATPPPPPPPPPPLPPVTPAGGRGRTTRVLSSLLLAALAIGAGALLWSLWSVPVSSTQALLTLQPRLPASLGLIMLAAMIVGGGIVWAFVFAWRAFWGRTATTPPSAATIGSPRTGDGDEAGSGRQRRRWTVAGLIIISAAFLLAEAVRGGSLRPVEAALILICGALTVVAASFAIESLATGEGLRFDSHWGGLGGGMGGWRLSPASTLVLLTLIFLAATFSAAGFLSQGGDSNQASTENAVNAVQPAEHETAPANSNAVDTNAANASGSSVPGAPASGGG